VRALSTALPSRQPSVVIADDSTVAREGLVAIIRRDLGYTVCGLATDERATRELTEKHQPDLLVIEPFLGHHDGIFLLKQLAARFPGPEFSPSRDSPKKFMQNARCAWAPQVTG
jgi:chemotaxis response regulator CheB